MCTGGREGGGESLRDTERRGEGPGRSPVISPSQICSLQCPRSSGPIHVMMSSLSNLGLTVHSTTEYQLLAGRLPELAWQGCSHRGRHLDTPHSQDELQQTPGWSGGQGDSWGLRGRWSPEETPPQESCPGYGPGYADVSTGCTFPCQGLAPWHSFGSPGSAAQSFPHDCFYRPECPSPGPSGLRITTQIRIKSHTIGGP